MYWPDFSRKKRKKRSPLWVAVLFGTFIGVFIAGNINGWWGFPSLPGEVQTDSVVAAVEPPSRTGAVEGQPSRAGSNGGVSIEEEPETSVPTSIPASTPISAPSRHLTEGAPDFVLPGLVDDTVSYASSQYAGQPIILNFWASWCIPCRTEMPALQRAHNKYKEKGVVILTINQTYVDDLDAARDFAAELELTLPLLRDDSGEVSSDSFEVRSLPTTIFIRPDGTVSTIQIGQMSDDQIEEVSRGLAAENKSN